MPSPICTVTGSIVDSQGTPLAAVGVRVTPLSGADVARGTFTGDGDLVNTESFEVLTNNDGQFAFNIIQGLRCVIAIDVLGYSRQVLIPMSSSVQLKDL